MHWIRNLSNAVDADELVVDHDVGITVFLEDDD